jgi:hypothetical protein
MASINHLKKEKEEENNEKNNDVLTASPLQQRAVTKDRSFTVFPSFNSPGLSKDQPVTTSPSLPGAELLSSSNQMYFIIF